MRNNLFFSCPYRINFYVQFFYKNTYKYRRLYLIKKIVLGSHKLNRTGHYSFEWDDKFGYAIYYEIKVWIWHSKTVPLT